MKKTFRMLLVLALVLVMTCSSAMACTVSNDTQAKLNKTLYAMVEAANLAVKAQVKIAQETPYNDVAWLKAATEATVAPVFAYAELIGATVECEYKEYVVDGEIVLIDPLKVINVKGTYGEGEGDEG